MIRTVQLSEITENIKEMCIEANHFLSPDMAEAMKQAQQNEKSPLGKQILGQLQENLEIAAQDPDLSGYRNGSCLSGDRTGCTL